MKNLSFLPSIIVAITMLISLNVTAQNFPDLDVSPLDAASFPSSYKISDKLIKVIYSRPQLKGRPLSKLTPDGEVWRTGANEATQIMFYKPVMLGDSKIKAGTYSLFTIPGEKEWTVIINSDVNAWGAYTYDKSKDVARMIVPIMKNNDMIEAFSITFEETDQGATMFLGWGDVIVPISFLK